MLMPVFDGARKRPRPKPAVKTLKVKEGSGGGCPRGTPTIAVKNAVFLHISRNHRA